MKYSNGKLSVTVILLIIFCPACFGESVYTYKTPSRDGIGKYYMGREISHVMGHPGAAWLDRESRRGEERTDLLLKMLPIERASVIADLGAGTGYFSLQMARMAPDGRVLAVDLQPEMLDIIVGKSAEQSIDNIEPILATETDPRLPESSVDLVLIVDAYHEFSHPREVMTGVFAGLKTGGLVYLVEYRAEDRRVPIKRLHKMSEAQARLELESIGLRWTETLKKLPQQHVLVFRKP